MQSKAATVAAYLASLPADRRAAIEAVRAVILKHLGKGYAEGMQYGMIGYYLPHSVYPPGYHCDPAQPLPFAALASQKNHMSLYLMGLYIGSETNRADLAAEVKWFQDAWKKTGRRLDMGKACVRFKRLEDVPLEVVGEAIRRVPAKTYIARYEATLALIGKAPRREGAPAAKPASPKKKSASGPSSPTTRKKSAGARPGAASPARKKSAARRRSGS